MAGNLDRFKNDVDQLVNDGQLLYYAFIKQTQGVTALTKTLNLTPENEEKLIDILPDFNVAYESWYSESVVLLKQILPHRLQGFKDHFEVPKNRKELTAASYRIHDALHGLNVNLLGANIVDETAAITHVRQQLAIIMAAQRRFQSSLFEIRQLVQADLFDSELDAAKELLKNKFVRAAGAIAGVVLEKHLRQVCDGYAIKIVKKNPGISDFNEALKAASVIEIPQWRHITLMGDYRNLCDHNKANEPTNEQVTALLDGTEKIIKTVF